jgi:negative regulator of replication initiation
MATCILCIERSVAFHAHKTSDNFILFLRQVGRLQRRPNVQVTRSYHGREMILVAPDDHLLDPSGNKDVTARIHGAEVASVQPSVVI